MSERNRAGVVELWIKAVSPTLVVASILIGVWNYRDAAERESRRPFWEKRIELYFEATSAAASIASSDQEAEVVKARNTFWRLYYGPLALVEDRAVEKAMVAFGTGLRGETAPHELQRLSLELAHACRASIGETWSLQLEELTNRAQ